MKLEPEGVMMNVVGAYYLQVGREVEEKDKLCVIKLERGKSCDGSRF